MHVLTKKKNESFSIKGLASITTNTTNMIKMCYNKITNIANKDTTTRQMVQQIW